MHRTLAERLGYLAAYRCLSCGRRSLVPRRYQYHCGSQARCPLCGSFGVERLHERGNSDQLFGGFLDVLELLAGGKRFRCPLCRIRFHDGRRAAPSAEPLK